MDKAIVEQNWGTQQNIAPTRRRTDPYAFLTGSLILGSLVGAASMWILWRPMPFLDLPAGSFAEHAQFTLKWLLHQISPHVYTADAKWYAELVASYSRPIKVGMALRLSLSLAAASLPAFWLARIHLKPSDAMMEIRGGHRFELGDGATELAVAMKTIKNAIPDFDFAPNIPYPSQIWSQHVLAVGGVGAGKSTFMRPLLQRIVKSGDRLLCFDPKGEFTAGFKTPIVMAPWDARSYAWDIAADMRNHGDMERFAAAVIKDSQDPMWSNAARGLLVGFLVYLQSARGTEWGWQDLADMLTLPEEDILPLMQRYYPEASRAVAAASVTTKGILINLDSFCRPIFHLARAWGQLPPERRISFVRWTKDPKIATRQIMLQGNGAYPELTRAYVEGIVSVIAGIVNSVELDDDPARKLWILADEFAQMGKIPIRPLFEVGRSRGVRCVVACQDFAQLEEVHGKEGTRALISMCGTLMVGRIGPGETAETLSKNLGTREVERSNVSTSYDGKAGSTSPTTTLTYSRDSLALYVPAELAARLGDKPSLSGCVFAVAVQGKTYEILWPYFSMPKVRKAHVAAQWTLGVQHFAEPAKHSGPDSGNGDQKSGGTAGGHGGGGVQPPLLQPLNGDRSNQPVSPNDQLRQSSLNAAPIEDVAVDVVTVPTTPAQASSDRLASEGENFNAVEVVSAMVISHDPAETAAHLALQALEILKPRPGPPQHVQPKTSTSVKSRR
jgi:type IV secretory pathway TraG/TraD family ATPase VirD4